MEEGEVMCTAAEANLIVEETIVIRKESLLLRKKVMGIIRKAKSGDISAQKLLATFRKLKKYNYNAMV